MARIRKFLVKDVQLISYTFELKHLIVKFILIICVLSRR